MNSRIIYVKCKTTWPLGNRDLILAYTGVTLQDGTAIITGKSMEHPDIPEKPKMTRIFTTQASFLLTPINGGKGCKFIYITEVLLKHILKGFYSLTSKDRFLSI